MRILALLGAALVLVSAAGAHAIEFKPYAREAITASQWQDYFDQVKTAVGPSMQELRSDKLVVFNDGATATSYTFTVPGHPAHPAWITRRIVQQGGQLYVDQIGYYAGQEAPFAVLFRQYEATNKRMVEEMKRKAGGH